MSGLDVELPSDVKLKIDRFAKHLDARIEMAAAAGGDQGGKKKKHTNKRTWLSTVLIPGPLATLAAHVEKISQGESQSAPATDRERVNVSSSPPSERGSGIMEFFCPDNVLPSSQMSHKVKAHQIKGTPIVNKTTNFRPIAQKPARLRILLEFLV